MQPPDNEASSMASNVEPDDAIPFLPPPAPVWISPGLPITAGQIWTPAILPPPPRDAYTDAFYADERGGQVRKESHPLRSCYNRFNMVDPGGIWTEGTAGSTDQQSAE
jgi:hypothetical protein